MSSRLSTVRVLVLGIAAGVLVGGAGALVSRPREIASWFASLEAPEGWSAHPVILVAIALLALFVGLLVERSLRPFMERSVEPETPIVGDAGPGRFPPGSGWNAFDREDVAA